MKRILLALGLLVVLTMFTAPAWAARRHGVSRGYFGGTSSHYRPNITPYHRGPIHHNSYYQYYHTRNPDSRAGYSNIDYSSGPRPSYRSPGVYGLYTP